MSNAGRLLYVPKDVVLKLENIKKRKGKKRNREAWRDMLFYTNVGQNVDDVYSVVFGVRK